jgi:hypothetical protein
MAIAAVVGALLLNIGLAAGRRLAATRRLATRIAGRTAAAASMVAATAAVIPATTTASAAIAATGIPAATTAATPAPPAGRGRVGHQEAHGQQHRNCHEYSSHSTPPQFEPVFIKSGPTKPWPMIRNRLCTGQCKFFCRGNAAKEERAGGGRISGELARRERQSTPLPRCESAGRWSFPERDAGELPDSRPVNLPTASAAADRT